ncbi:MAG TPA: cytochrome c oxidase assembly protein [Gaiellaceae bacterium]|nr:cytochrome c oxidase assembly protein [Gaiellaceae bacterium]
MSRPDPYSWTVHPEATLAVAGLAVAYWLAVRGRPVERWRIAAFAGGCLLLVVTAVTPLEALSYHLLTMHLLQNVVLAEWAPALLVLGIPPFLAERLTRRPAVRTLTWPPVALGLWLLTYFAWHLPAAYDTALEHPTTLLHLEHACYLAAGTLLWWPVLQDLPHRLSNASRALYLFLAFVLASPIGLLLALAPDAAYDYYVEGDGLWGLSAHADQQIAGVTMSAEQAVVFFAVFAVFFFRFLRDEEALPAGTE